jgi:hypothetical protein
LKMSSLPTFALKSNIFIYIFIIYKINE